ncbi:unnamed protein product [Fusarium venenatum]|uniref:Uncharacterized protein n=1 Tax=Fusarium venenatum TaxID=56646 RepID=A0A2L2U1W9_9HYPO|nr:uncharacterized protein FVRRES_09477 [Fusarium venenatum]CEI69400.1 unnamed protein product [Fusarium venenatum]
MDIPGFNGELGISKEEEKHLVEAMTDLDSTTGGSGRLPDRIERPTIKSSGPISSIYHMLRRNQMP